MTRTTFLLLLVAASGFAACQSDPTSATNDSALSALKRSSTSASPAIAIRLQTQKQGSQWAAIAVMDADGSHRTNVYIAPTASSQFASYTGPSWSPSGESISFVEHSGTQPGTSSLKRINVALVNGVPTGSAATTLLTYSTPTSSNIRSQAWSPSSSVSEIGYIWMNSDPNTGGAGPLSSFSVRVIPASGGQPTAIYTSPSGHISTDIAWSPDGSELAVSDYDNSTGYMSILIIDRATGAVLQTLVGGTYGTIRGIDWSSDGNTLAFGAALPGGSSYLYTLSLAQGSQPVQGIAGSRPTWSGDNSALAYNVTVESVGKVVLATGAASVLYSTTGGYPNGYPDWKR
jgi:Tol biopolymer transport system component